MVVKKENEMKTHYVLNTSSLNILSPLRATPLSRLKLLAFRKNVYIRPLCRPMGTPEYVVYMLYLNVKNV